MRVFHAVSAAAALSGVFLMLRRPSAASPTVPVGALRTPWNVAEPFTIGLDDCQGCPLSSPSHGMAHSSRKVSIQPYTVTDANALVVKMNVPVRFPLINKPKG